MKPKNITIIEWKANPPERLIKTCLSNAGRNVFLRHLEISHFEGDEDFTLILEFREEISCGQTRAISFDGHDDVTDLLYRDLCGEKGEFELSGRVGGQLTFTGIIGKNKFTKRGVSVLKDMCRYLVKGEWLNEVTMYQKPVVRCRNGVIPFVKRLMIEQGMIPADPLFR